jgi:hypothetical protein
LHELTTGVLACENCIEMTMAVMAGEPEDDD